MFSIHITKKSIVLQPSQQKLLQQKLPCHLFWLFWFLLCKEIAIHLLYMQSYLCFLLFFSIIKQKGNTKDEAQLAQFLCFIPTYFSRNISCDRNSTGHRCTTQADVFPSFSGSSSSGPIFSGSSGSSSKRNRNLLAYRRDPIFLSFLSLSILNQPPTMQITRNIIRTTTTATFLALESPQPLLLYLPTLQEMYIITAITITTNITQQKGSGKSKKRAVTWMLRREESGCFLLADGIPGNQGPCV